MVNILDIYRKTFHCIKQHIYLALVRKPCHHIANAGTKGSVGVGESHDVFGVKLFHQHHHHIMRSSADGYPDSERVLTD